ncbi:hypothetical protein ACEWY4_001036 [Coilia grayii]|uniref:Uncharacterized protein n=1 Tax=Coilia grayii TaxID=363190 RepID=A0ABD1KYD7_9TELE
MRAVCWYVLCALLFFMLTITHSDQSHQLEPVKTDHGPLAQHTFVNTMQYPKHSAHLRLHRRRHSGHRKEEKAMPSYGGSLQAGFGPQEEGPEVEGMTPVRLEMGSREWGAEGERQGPEEIPHRHKQVEGLRDLVFRLHKVSSDRTDSKQDKESAADQKSGNMTDTHGDPAAPCDHHVDCPQGSCCDLRRHTCEVHNRSLNNKCYADCMCEEGFRCYTKFHQNVRVKQKRGQCVDPHTVNMSQGAFITI